ncbi:MAG: hypothetical protein OEZ06_26915 [Myxococcales bacterium]|nr:hypothetical protein [Myxococcales bacterium]
MSKETADASGPWDGLDELRVRLHEISRDRSAGAVEREAALGAVDTKRRLALALAAPDACTRCSRHDAKQPQGFEGGRCCSHPLGRLFTEDMLAMLATGGMGGEALQGPAHTGAGCAFRDRLGCTLQPAQRPNACAGYICQSLSEELQTKGAREGVATLCAELEDSERKFRSARTLRLAALEIEALLNRREG